MNIETGSARSVFPRLSQNQLKLIACVSMLIDHVGYEFFPGNDIFRIIGRLAFPVFSYGIYSGCRYTRSRLKYFLRIFSMGLLCLFGYYLFSGEWFGNIFITFSLSVCLLSSAQILKASVEKRNLPRIALGILFMLSSLAASALLDSFCDYGFFGIILPIFPWLADTVQDEKCSERMLNLTFFASGLLILCIRCDGIQYYSLFAVFLLAFTSGERGRYKLKWFFYLFYPLHLIIIGIISMFI